MDMNTIQYLSPSVAMVMPKLDEQLDHLTQMMPQQGYPMQQQGYPTQQPTGGYPQQGVPGSILPQQSPSYPQQNPAYPVQQQPGGYPIQMSGIPGNMPNHFAAGVGAAEQKIGNVFGDEMKGKVA